MNLIRHGLTACAVSIFLTACTSFDAETGAAAVSAGTQPAVRLFLIGDSTLADKPPARAPETGWGMALADMAHPRLTVANHAVNGRSSKSFYDEGRWQVVLNQLRPGDYVLIQFGHNDQKVEDPLRFTTPDGGYTENLRRYVMQAREKGALAILATSICRRHFNEQGELQFSHGRYPDAVRQLAMEMEVALVDLQAATAESLQEMGPTVSTRLYLHVEPGRFEYYKDGKIDNTHLSPDGASWVARLFLAELRLLNHPLADYFYLVE